MEKENLLFQFQSGTIKARSCCARALARARFQFQSGTIKAEVRHGKDKRRNPFQFQSGTIKAGRGGFCPNG